MRRLILSCAVLGALVFGQATSGEAATYHLGTQKIGSSKTVYHGGKGNFENFYKFRVAEAMNIGSHGSVHVKSGYNVSNLTLSLYQRHGTQWYNIKKIATDSGRNVAIHVSGLDPSKQYIFRVTGNGIGAKGGKYKLAYKTSAVPLPPAIWLFLSAIVGLAGVVRQKRKKAALAQNRDALAPA